MKKDVDGNQIRGYSLRVSQPQRKNKMKTPRQPRQSAELVKVTDLRDRKSLVKTTSGKNTHFWILYPSTGTESPLVHIHSQTTNHIMPADEQRIVRIAQIAVAPRTPTTLDGLDTSSLFFA